MRGDLHRVQIRAQHLGRAALVAPGPVDQAPTGRLEVDVHVDEHRRGAADHVPAGSTAGQFRQVWEVRQLAHDHLHGLVAVVVRQRTDAGRHADAPRNLHVARPYAVDHRPLVLTNDRAILILVSKGALTRQAILHHGVEVAYRVGLGGLSIGTLATGTGMSKSGLFAHFGSKESLQLEVLAQARAEFVDTVVRPAPGHAAW